jgi:hypothetical protein
LQGGKFSIGFFGDEFAGQPRTRKRRDDAWRRRFARGGERGCFRASLTNNMDSARLRDYFHVL